MSMAEEEKNEAPPKEKKPAKKGKKGLLVGGFVGLLGFAYLAAMMAIPAGNEVRRFAGPFVVPLFDEKFHTNLDDEDHTRFLQMNMNLVVVAYEEAYVAARRLDPLYQSYMLDAILRVSFTKRIDQVLGDQVALGVYLEEIRTAVDPILFPVHIGEGMKPTELDPASGLGPGLSIEDASLREAWDEHVLHVDAAARTLRLDEGPEVPFQGREDDLEVRDDRGRAVFIDVTGIVEDFVGEVKVGTKGRLRKVLAKDLLVQ
jgi:hypothetical protein